MVTMSVVIRPVMLAGRVHPVREEAGLALSGGECQATAYTLPTMPIYEYRCENGHTFETLQRMADDPLRECEICGAPAQRVLHAPAVHFKGSGFYNTDYGTKKRARELKSAGEGKSGSDSTKTSSSDGKSSSDGASSSSSSSGDSSAKSGAASS
jgi:putative FmdB family regulatory protein